jgi:hypothetical protein
MCESPHLSRRHLLRVAGAAALGSPLVSAVAQMSSVAQASEDQTLDYAAPMIATIAPQQVPLEPVDAVDVTIVVDNAIDILAADTPVSTRKPLVVGNGIVTLFERDIAIQEVLRWHPEQY